MSRAQLIRLTERIMAYEGTQDEVSEWLTILERNVPDPEVSNYIFWPDREMTSEEIVDRALAYKPIQL